MIGIGSAPLRRWAVALAAGMAVSLSAAAHTFFNGVGNFTAASPTFHRPDQPVGCATTTGLTHYAAHTLNMPQDGTVSALMLGRHRPGGAILSGYIDDPYLLLYAGSFDPNNPCTNLIAFDDDSAEGVTGLYNARLTRAVTSGSYVLVAATYDQLGAGVPFEGSYDLTITSNLPDAVPTLQPLAVLLLAGLMGAMGLRRARRRG